MLVLTPVFMAAYDEHSFSLILGVLELLSCPLYSAVYGCDFHRGPKLADSTSFFAGEDIWSPQQFGVIGEVVDLSVHNEYAILLLGRPQVCGSRMHLVWQQQISALERIELEDGSVDEGLFVVGVFLLCGRVL